MGFFQAVQSVLAKRAPADARPEEDLGLAVRQIIARAVAPEGMIDSAVAVLGDATLRRIARELVETVRKNVSIDWTLREDVRAHLRVLVKRILRRHGYPPDKQETATRTVQQLLGHSEVKRTMIYA